MAASSEGDDASSAQEGAVVARILRRAVGPVAVHNPHAAIRDAAEEGSVDNKTGQTEGVAAKAGTRRSATLRSIGAALHAALREQNRIEATYESLLSDSEARLARAIGEIAAERRRHKVDLRATQAALAETTAKATDIEEAASRLRSEYERMLADVERELLAKASEVENLQSKIFHRQQEIEAKANRLLSEHERKLGDAQANLVAKTSEVEDLQVRLSHVRRESERLEGEISELSRTLEARSEETRRVQGLLAEERARREETDQRLRVAGTQLAALRCDLATARHEFDNQALKLQALDRLWLVRMRRSLLTIGRRLSGWRRRVVLRKKDNPLFDSEFYTAAYPDVAESGVDPYWHYLAHGAREGRNPNAMFRTTYYLERYPDVAEHGMNPLVHYFENGAAELRDPHPLFSTRWYVEQNRGTMQPGQNPLLHYLAAERARLG
ncbi:MAG: hypothetical protein U1E30_05975 [Rhodoblastus sp.]